jgi:Raf kinase inhibitor-like YbhB/YbcL family protein
MKRFAFLLLVAACGGDDSSSSQNDAAVDGAGSNTTDAAPNIDAPSGGLFTLTSPVLTEGATIMAVNTCDGANSSPMLAWTGNAIGALSFAVVLTDKSNNLVHWVIYDIPASAAGLPAAVEKTYAPASVQGAHQTASYQATTRGYLGPCPPTNGGAHTYEFAAYGIDVATLPGTSMMTDRPTAVALITQHMTAKATLTGMYER